MDPRRQSILIVFRDEASEILDAIERALLEIEKNIDAEANREAVREIKRRAHTLKGASRVVGFSDIQDAAHAFEERLQAVAPEGLLPSDEARALFAQVDEMRALLETATHPSAPASTIESAPSREEGEGILRVETRRLDRMMRLLGDLRLARAAGDLSLDELKRILEVFPSAKEALSVHERLDAVRSLLARRHSEEDLIVAQLGDELRLARLVPLSALALPLERVVRDLAADRGIQARFLLDGGEIGLDRTVIDALREPLLHLVRNAVAHGIESPAERRSARKPETGVIRIEARRLGSLVRITVADDGRGVDRERLRAEILRRGIAMEDEIGAMPETALLDLLFRSGLSTAASTDTVAGRGVGLDVVRTRVTAIRGEVRLAETGSAGTRFVLTLPVHLQILRVLSLRTPSGRYALPTVSIQKAGRASPDLIRMIEGSRNIRTDSGPIPLVSLDRALGLSSDEAATGDFLIVEAGGRRVALGVDEVVEETEALLRELGFPLAAIAVTAGAAVGSDGCVFFVLNPSELVAAALTTRRAPEVSATRAMRKRILVVDDSPTTRMLLRGIFVSGGFEVLTASDGVEANRLFAARGADAVVTDIEMPGMDGFTLTRAVKSASSGRVPVVLVTARESEKDRREGLAAGADAYIVKSGLDEAGILETVRRFL